MRILVTGGAGFIGSHACERMIERGHDVIIVDSFDPFYDPRIKRRNIEASMSTGRCVLIEADIADYDRIDTAIGASEIDAIIHLAARAGVRPSLERPLDYIRTNVEGTQSMLELARRRGIRPFVMGSSSSVYGDSTPVPFTESASASEPISPYAATKRAGELICHSHAHLYGLSVICLRLFTVYGPRQRPDLAIHKFAALMTKGEQIPLFGDGTTERDYTFVVDIVDGIEGALAWAIRAAPGSFEIVNLGESETTSLAGLVTLLSSELGVSPSVKWMPEQPGDVKRTFADISKARSLIGYDPRTSIKDGIGKFVEWFRTQPAD